MLLASSDERSDSSTPTTSSCVPLSVTVCPTASASAEQLRRRVRAQHDHRARLASSSASVERSARRHGPATARCATTASCPSASSSSWSCRPSSAADVGGRSGATASTSGASVVDASAVGVADGQRRGRAEPAAHAAAVGRCCRATPPGGWCRARRSGPATSALAPWPEPDREDHGGDADEDAEHRQRGAQPVRADRVERGAERVAPAHRPLRRIGDRCRVGHPSTRPSRIWIVRSARAATSGSWVISTMVRPAAVEVAEQAEHVGGRGASRGCRWARRPGSAPAR